jgi:hypothetical protein
MATMLAAAADRHLNDRKKFSKDRPDGSSYFLCSENLMAPVVQAPAAGRFGPAVIVLLAVPLKAFSLENEPLTL